MEGPPADKILGPPPQSKAKANVAVQSGSLDFSQIKLKKTETKEAQAEQLICADQASYDKLMKETYFEQYWEDIKKYTFPTELVSLPPAAAKAINEEHKNNKNVNWGNGPNKDILNGLATQIDEAARKNNWKGIFVRLSSRSPKDAASIQTNFPTILNEEVEKIKLEEKDAPTTQLNRVCHGIYRATTLALQVQTGAQALSLLIQSNRVQGDLEKVVDENDPNFNFVVREFSTFDVELEFRGFVHKKQLTAITQYNHLVKFPRMLEHKQEIAKTLLDFVDSEIKKLSIENLVLDFAMKYPVGDQPWKVYVVEINPLAEFAGSGLFTWEKDRAVLLGKKPFEFRTIDTVPSREFVLSELSPELLQFLPKE